MCWPALSTGMGADLRLPGTSSEQCPPCSGGERCPCFSDPLEEISAAAATHRQPEETHVSLLYSLG